jgi:ABC-type xylose transport system substrate-binding protein
MSGKYDGKDYPITGNPAADTASFKRVDDQTGESTFKKDGKVTATNVRVLSKDGKTLTITSKGTTADGKPRSDVQVFEKSSQT